MAQPAVILDSGNDSAKRFFTPSSGFSLLKVNRVNISKNCLMGLTTNYLMGNVKFFSRMSIEAAEFVQQADNEAKDVFKKVSDTGEALGSLAGILTKAESVVHGLENDSKNIGVILDVIGTWWSCGK